MSDNELIAEFMGLPLTKKSRTFSGTGHDVEIPFMTWKYDSSWDWLIPVVEKIEELGYAFEIVQENATIFDHCSKGNLNEIIPICGETKISATYQAVVQFIHWHNQQKQ